MVTYDIFWETDPMPSINSANLNVSKAQSDHISCFAGDLPANDRKYKTLFEPNMKIK